MTDNSTHESGDTAGGPAADDAATDGGRAPTDAATDGGVATGAAQQHRQTDYLDSEVNILNPSTPYMREHLRIVWTGFLIWAVTVFGPVTATYLAPGAMTTTMPIIGFPLHYFLIAIGGPGSALILSAWYARRRDELDDKYGIDHDVPGGDA
jgi:putative solute:sodium symporter small subunit